MIKEVKKMKYIRQEHIITTICDQNIEDLNEIKSLVEKIKDKRMYIFIAFRKKNNNYDEHIISYKNARLKKVYDNSIDFTVYSNTSTININNIALDDIIKIHVITEKNNILKIKGENKFGLLNLEGLE